MPFSYCIRVRGRGGGYCRPIRDTYDILLDDLAAQGVQHPLRGNQDRGGGHAPGVPEAAEPAPRPGRPVRRLARVGVLGPPEAGPGCPGRVLVLRPARPGRRPRPVHVGGRPHPLIFLRPRPRRHPGVARRDRRQHPLQPQHPETLYHGQGDTEGYKG